MAKVQHGQPWKSPDRCAPSRAWRLCRRTSLRRRCWRAGAQRRHQRLSGRPQQRRAGADRVPEAGASAISRRRASWKSWPAPTKVITDRDLRVAAEPASCCAFSATACAAAAAAKWCSKPSTRRALPDHRFRLPAGRPGSRRCAPTGRSPTTSTRPRCRCSTAPSTGCRLKDEDRGRRVHRQRSSSDPSLCRLYLGLPSWIARRRTRCCAKRCPCSASRRISHVLDFFGGMFEIRDGKAVVPGGPQSGGGLWTELVGRHAGSRGCILRRAAGQGRRLAGEPIRRALRASTVRCRTT